MFKLILILGKNLLEKSYSATSSNSFLEVRIPPQRSNFQSTLEEINSSSTIPDLRYSRQDQNLDPSLARSPTYSQMMSPNDEPAQLMMMTAEFEIDKEFLRNKAKPKKHKEKSAWFFSNLTYE